MIPLNTTFTYGFTFGENGTRINLDDILVRVIEPDGTTYFINSTGAITAQVATGVALGEFTVAILLDQPGLWRVALVQGTEDTHEIIYEYYTVVTALFTTPKREL